MTSANPNMQHAIAPGTEVEVLTRYQGRWVAGFEIHAVRDGRYTLRRRSDNTVLASAFAMDDVRPRR